MSTTTTTGQLRSFNRRWTEILGLLDRHLLDTPYSLTEARVLYELAQHDEPRSATERLDLRRALGIDASFLTRVLTRLERAGLVESATSPADGRQRRLRLTAAGRNAAADLDRRSTAQIDGLLSGLTADQQRTLGETTAVAGALVAPSDERSVTIRGLQPGDRGWVVQRHGAIYADEYGWNEEFERLVAKIVAEFQGGEGERAWIAEVDGARAACVFCCRAGGNTAQLRILLVEPWARGLGLGARLVDECVAFARDAGYREVILWTNDVLVAARRIYQAAGFELVDEDPHHSFGHDLVGQHWRLSLSP
jgi:DNA-binding MarR family transcriptional regulator/GNAT superfamily N-acetyltransferase